MMKALWDGGRWMMARVWLPSIQVGIKGMVNCLILRVKHLHGFRDLWVELCVLMEWMILFG